MGLDSVTRKAFPMRKAKLRSVELPMKENTMLNEGKKVGQDLIENCLDCKGVSKSFQF